MTIEEAKKIYYPISGVNLSDKKDLLDLIYEDFEEQLKQAHTDGYNDCYKKLMNKKICDGCKK